MLSVTPTVGDIESQQRGWEGIKGACETGENNAVYGELQQTGHVTQNERKGLGKDLRDGVDGAGVEVQGEGGNGVTYAGDAYPGERTGLVAKRHVRVDGAGVREGVVGAVGAVV